MSQMDLNPPLRRTRMDKRKTVCILIVVLIVFGALLGLLFIKGGKIAGSVACIYSNGKLIKTIELKSEDDYTFEVKSENGGVNTIQVKDGKIGVISADCPDKICVNTGKITKAGESVICVPAHVSVTVEGESEADYALG